MYPIPGMNWAPGNQGKSTFLSTVTDPDYPGLNQSVSGIHWSEWFKGGLDFVVGRDAFSHWP